MKLFLLIVGGVMYLYYGYISNLSTIATQQQQNIVGIYAQASTPEGVDGFLSR